MKLGSCAAPAPNDSEDASDELPLPLRMAQQRFRSLRAENAAESLTVKMREHASSICGCEATRVGRCELTA